MPEKQQKGSSEVKHRPLPKTSKETKHIAKSKLIERIIRKRQQCRTALQYRRRKSS